MNETGAGYGCGQPFQTKFSAAGLSFSVCLVVYTEMDNDAMTARMAGFEAACSERGATSMTPIYVTGSMAERQDIMATEMSSFLGSH
eukprot:CAMPEP_0206623828 /NCGR_PEP_ID=MMETSP0325_2-20121206/63709_1 /ASSEMBLY_ACC=CAM_ASM_000347 /TAXON_ID=2866 /ORGANISM="Crypthecodinium cohnii, Strain Seligo" /LENGTH=86 /DNA_ID=CAMNT_0054147569 /DNA_START=19 /DNA_END=276 /DNA_ORIENTATION=-